MKRLQRVSHKAYKVTSVDFMTRFIAFAHTHQDYFTYLNNKYPDTPIDINAINPESIDSSISQIINLFNTFHEEEDVEWTPDLNFETQHEQMAEWDIKFEDVYLLFLQYKLTRYQLLQKRNQKQFNFLKKGVAERGTSPKAERFFAQSQRFHDYFTDQIVLLKLQIYSLTISETK